VYGNNAAARASYPMTSGSSIETPAGTSTLLGEREAFDRHAAAARVGQQRFEIELDARCGLEGHDFAQVELGEVVLPRAPRAYGCIDREFFVARERVVARGRVDRARADVREQRIEGRAADPDHGHVVSGHRRRPLRESCRSLRSR
jgi:hypothetical protein